MEKFEEIMDQNMIVASSQENLFDLVLCFSNQFPNLRLKEHIDAVNSWMKFQEASKNQGLHVPSRAERRAIERAQRRKKKNGKKNK